MKNSKKYLIFITYLLLFFFNFNNIFVNVQAADAPANAGVNLLKNPGFEAGLTDWISTGTTGVAQQIGGSAGYNYKSGQYSLKHQKNAPYETYTYQTVTGLADGIYSASAWVRRPSSAGSHEIAQMEVTVGNCTVGSSVYSYAQKINTTTLAAFSQITINNIVVENGAGQITVSFHSKSSVSNQVIYIDDVELKMEQSATTLYTVTYETYGGSAIEPVKIAAGSLAAKPADPTKSGCYFEGWYTDGSYANAFNFSTPINSNITLCAKWSAIPIDPDNKILDPGFEEASLVNWTVNSSGSGLIEKAAGTQNINYRSGAYSIKHQSSGVHEAKTSQTVTNLKQGLYTASAYVRMPTPSFDIVRMEVTTGASSTVPQYSLNISQNSTFVLFSIQDILVTDGNLTLTFYSKTGASGQVLYIDDVSLKLTQEVTDYYTVSFNTDGGSAVADRYAAAGKTVNAPPSPKKTGFTFEGWYTTAAFTDTFDFSTPINSNITVFAKWAEIPVDPDNFIKNPSFEKPALENWKITSSLPSIYTISEGTQNVDYNSGTAALKLTQSKRYQVWATQKVEGLEKGYYTAKAWVKRPVAVRNDDIYKMQVSGFGDSVKTADIPGSTVFVQVTIDNILVTTGTCTLEFYVQTFDNHILYIDDVELKKTSEPYTNLVANFDSMGGSFIKNIEADSGNKITPPAPPVKTGYTFAGWYTDKSFAQLFDFEQSISGDITLYAKWQNSPIPMIGNIRWDVLTGYAPFDELNSLSLEKYNYRAPFFTSIDGNFKVTGNDNSIATMEQEIDYAVAGGIDYWAFTTGPELGKNNPEYYALNNFLATDKRFNIGFSVIIHRYNDTPWENRIDMLTKWMQEPNFVKVMGNRPLLYIYRVSELEAKYGAGAGTQAAIDLIRTKAQAAGLGNPYIVAMASSTPESLAQNNSYIETYGLDAISAYGYAGERNESNLNSYAPYSVLSQQNIASWENYKATGKKMIPLAALGRNEEPRKDTSVVYGGGYGPYFDNPTPTEAANQIKAGLQYVLDNKSVCESNAILSYAWNEFAEGGWICPTLSEGSSKLDAIHQMKVDFMDEINPHTFETTFVADNVETKVVTVVGKQIEMPSAPTKNGYTFKGWFTAATGGSEVTEFTSAQTVYAQWVANNTGIPANNTTATPIEKKLTLNVDSKGEITLKANELLKRETLVINGDATLELNKTVLEYLNAQDNITATIKLWSAPLDEEIQKVIGNRPVYELNITVDGKPVTSFGATKIKVSIPYQKAANENENAIVAYYVNKDGELIPIKHKYNTSSNTIELETNHFSKFTVGYNEVKFADVNNEWFSDAITFISARGIAKGVSANTFAPNANVTRGEFITMLCRAYGIEEKTGENFADSGNTYYTGFLAAAKQLKLSNGVGNNKFAPEEEITREEMFTLLYNTLNVLGELHTSKGRDISTFNDAKDISSWSTEAMKYLVENGVITGSDNKLSPRNKASRAEISQILYNLLK